MPEIPPVHTQDAFLTEMRDKKAPLIIFLVNGFQIRGTIETFDPYVVIVRSEDKQQVVYKHAISTMVPLFPGTSRDGGHRPEKR
ncbi:RNA chaperone Hfq [Alicyclobacillus tolerans]|uniref:RNA chaperone Hfq n=1 Tax=Alicyclobacillus tolerans TaxID=90970 RepID=UPI001F00B3DC|nr:RNA chaperone Hfq [Alicyclobacillus tolerans]MCF8567041.1 RNA chaperone Hfq [Alicyclobacillus tolerans]